MNKTVKRILAGLWIACGIFFMILLINYADNESNVKDYKKGQYGVRSLGALGFTQPYVEPYNEGCMYYQLGDYDSAEAKFREALEKNPSHTNSEECKIRINLVLSMIADLDPENVNSENADEFFALIDEAKEILCEEDCAHMYDEDGHNADAQRLKDELDGLEEQIKQQLEEEENGESSENSSSDNNDDRTQTSDGAAQNETETEKSDVQKELESIQNQGNQERSSEIQEYSDYYDYLEDGGGYYSGPSW